MFSNYTEEKVSVQYFEYKFLLRRQKEGRTARRNFSFKHFCEKQEVEDEEENEEKNKKEKEM